jgi:hypothetical protein
MKSLIAAVCCLFAFNVYAQHAHRYDPRDYRANTYNQPQYYPPAITIHRRNVWVTVPLPQPVYVVPQYQPQYEQYEEVPRRRRMRVIIEEDVE